MDGPRAGGEGEGATASAASPVYHGGDLTQARAAHPHAPEPWIDLSTGINPVAYPIPPIPAELWTRLPETALVAATERAAAAAFAVADPRLVAATPGTQAVIQMLPRLLDAGTVGILGFTYQEHARVWREAGRSVRVVDTLADLAPFDLAVVVNPNNPDGRLIAPERLAAFARGQAAAGRGLIVDEAFVDVLPATAGLAAHLPLPGTVVLRSFGKTWGLAGLRLGFALAEAAFAARLRSAFGPWAVSGPALAVGAAALADRDWLAAAIRRLERDAGRLDRLLAAAGFDLLGGTPLYRLAGRSDAAAVADRLAEAGIHVRRFPHDATLLRFGLPGSLDAWDRLAVALGTDRTE